MSAKRTERSLVLASPASRALKPVTNEATMQNTITNRRHQAGQCVSQCVCTFSHTIVDRAQMNQCHDIQLHQHRFGQHTVLQHNFFKRNSSALGTHHARVVRHVQAIDPQVQQCHQVLQQRRQPSGVGRIVIGNQRHKRLDNVAARIAKRGLREKSHTSTRSHIHVPPLVATCARPHSQCLRPDAPTDCR